MKRPVIQILRADTKPLARALERIAEALELYLSTQGLRLPPTPDQQQAQARAAEGERPAVEYSDPWEQFTTEVLDRHRSGEDLAAILADYD